MTRPLRLLLSALVVLLTLVVTVNPHPAAAAAPQQVGDCTFATLQSALQGGGDWYYAPGQCSGNSPANTITFTDTITISTDASLTSNGTDIVLDGNSTVRLFVVDTTNAAVSFGLTGLTLNNGEGGSSANSVIDNFGGAVANEDAGTVIITNCAFSGNSAATSGGAIRNPPNGTVTITNSTFSGSSAITGGAIRSGGLLTVSDSTFYNNTASAAGGAIFSVATTTITNSTFSGNSASNEGSAINTNGGATTITDSTLAGNTTSGSALHAVTTGTSVGGSILSDNTDSNCNGPLTDSGYNLEWTGSTDTSTGYTCGFSAAENDVVGQDPQLLPLGNNGGPTQTMALQSTSPAIDIIPTSVSALCPASGADGRGYPRPDNNESVCDIGAYEFADPSSTTLANVSGTGTYGGTATLTATLSANTLLLSGESVAFTLHGVSVGSGITGSDGVATLTGVDLTGYDAGVYSGYVAAAFAGDAGNQGSGPMTGDLTVDKASQATLTVTGPTTGTYNETYTLTSSGGSGTGGVTYDAGASTGCTVSADQVTITSGTNSCMVTATKAADTNYLSTTSDAASVTVNKAAQTITVTMPAPNSAANGDTFTVAATAGSTDPVTFTSSGGCKNNGSSYKMTSDTTDCTVIFDQPGDANYGAAPQVTETVTPSGAPTLTYLAASSVRHVGKEMTVHWRMATSHGVVGFHVYGGTRLLSRSLLPVHRNFPYSFTARYAGTSGVHLGVVLMGGQEVRIALH